MKGDFRVNETYREFFCKLRKPPVGIRLSVLVLCLLLAFCSGAVLAGFYVNRQGSRSTGRLDSQYALEHGRAAETIGKLAAELERERELNRGLREYNNQARAIAGGLADTVERNVRNLQEAVGLIGEIRTKFKILADFYSDSSSGGGDS